MTMMRTVNGGPPEPLTQEMVDELTEARSRAAVVLVEDARRGLSSTRKDFAIASMYAGLISEAEAEGWAEGNLLPTVLREVIENLFPEGRARTAARIEAKAAQTVERMNPLVLALQAKLRLTDEEVDALFRRPGVTNG